MKRTRQGSNAERASRRRTGGHPTHTPILHVRDVANQLNTARYQSASIPEGIRFAMFDPAFYRWGVCIQGSCFALAANAAVWGHTAKNILKMPPTPMNSLPDHVQQEAHESLLSRMILTYKNASWQTYVAKKSTLFAVLNVLKRANEWKEKDGLSFNQNRDARTWNVWFGGEG